jgi:Predicted dithiol-disulfide isomerase involved in polyketide biosynthesis
LAIRMKVWIDFVCPYCCLGEAAIRQATAGLDVEVVWMPFELRPPPAPPLRIRGEYFQNAWRQVIYPLAERLGITMRMPALDPQPYTRTAFEGLQLARERGLAAEYVRGVFGALFERGLDIGRIDVLAGVARDAGLPEEELIRAQEEGRYAEAHLAELRAAEINGIRAVPTIIAGTQRIEGVPDPERLRQLLQSELQRAGADAV